MFPIKRHFLEKFYVNNDTYYELILGIINKNRNTIINQAQKYLIDYQSGKEILFSTNIDVIIKTINEYDVVMMAEKQIAASNEEGS